MLDLACRWRLVSVTYTINMFGNVVAFCILSFDAPKVFEATETLTDNYGDCDDLNNKAGDGSAKT